MSYLKRLYDIGEERVNNFRKKYGNPLKEFEAALNELRTDLNELMKQAAEFNAVKIRSEQDMQDYKARIVEFEKKAESVLSNENAKPEAAEKAAAHALSMKRVYADKLQSLSQQISEIDEKLIFIKDNIEQMQDRIARYEKEYEFLKQKYEQSAKKTEFNYGYEPDIDSRFDAMKQKLETREAEYDKLERLADDMYLADKYIHDSEIQDELDTLKEKMKK